MTKRLQLRLTTEEYINLKSLAKKAGKTVSGFLKHKAFAGTSEHVEENEYICPSSEKLNFTIAKFGLRSNMALKFLMNEELGKEEATIIWDKIGLSAEGILKKVYKYREIKKEEKEEKEEE